MAQKTIKKLETIDWDEKYLKVVQEQLEDFERQGIKPTFRGMYYTLVDLGLLPKTSANYKQLNKVSVRWRERGLVQIDAFIDRTRKVSQDFDDVYETQEDYGERFCEYLENADVRTKVNEEFDFSRGSAYYSVPLWYRQPNYVEIWLEKDAALGTIQSIVQGLQVIVAPNRGQSSVAFSNESIERLKKEQRKGKKIYIIYLGDEDPSGEDMDRVYKERLARYGIFDVVFIRLAVTQTQKDRFNLQTDPDPETLEKLQMDANRFKFMEKYELVKISKDPDNEYVRLGKKNNVFLSSYVIKEVNGGYLKHDPRKLFAVQLEAMQTPKVRAYLKAVLRYKIHSLYDGNVRAQVLKDHPPGRTMRLVLQNARKLVDRLEVREEAGEFDD